MRGAGRPADRRSRPAPRNSCAMLAGRVQRPLATEPPELARRAGRPRPAPARDRRSRHRRSCAVLASLAERPLASPRTYVPARCSRAPARRPRAGRSRRRRRTGLARAAPAWRAGGWPHREPCPRTSQPGPYAAGRLPGACHPHRLVNRLQQHVHQSSATEGAHLLAATGRNSASDAPRTSPVEGRSLAGTAHDSASALVIGAREAHTGEPVARSSRARGAPATGNSRPITRQRVTAPVLVVTLGGRASMGLIAPGGVVGSALTDEYQLINANGTTLPAPNVAAGGGRGERRPRQANGRDRAAMAARRTQTQARRDPPSGADGP